MTNLVPNTNLSIHTQTNLLAGNRVEITMPDLLNLPVGTKLDVFVIIPQAANPQKISVFEMLKQAPTTKAFKTAHAVDEYLDHERNSWDG
jgi:hypothetical protein